VLLAMVIITPRCVHCILRIQWRFQCTASADVNHRSSGGATCSVLLL
jgi:hypothetical protein